MQAFFSTKQKNNVEVVFSPFFFPQMMLMRYFCVSVFSKIKTAVPKPSLTGGGDFIFAIKNVFISFMEKIADVFERKTHGASFELYTSFIRHQEHNKKLSDLLK